MRAQRNQCHNLPIGKVGFCTVKLSAAGNNKRKRKNMVRSSWIEKVGDLSIGIESEREEARWGIL